MIAEKPIAAGHFIKLEGGEQGYVTKVGWRSTHPTSVRQLQKNDGYDDRTEQDSPRAPQRRVDIGGEGSRPYIPGTQLEQSADNRRDEPLALLIRLYVRCELTPLSAYT
jgi:hypothetical protein